LHLTTFPNLSEAIAEIENIIATGRNVGGTAEQRRHSPLRNRRDCLAAGTGNPWTPEKVYYRIAVADGWVIDHQGHYVRDFIGYNCDNSHRSVTAANTCRDLLIAYSSKTGECF
jgi:hypothetical protein